MPSGIIHILLESQTQLGYVMGHRGADSVALVTVTSNSLVLDLSRLDNGAVNCSSVQRPWAKDQVQHSFSCANEYEMAGVPTCSGHAEQHPSAGAHASRRCSSNPMIDTMPSPSSVGHHSATKASSRLFIYRIDIILNPCTAKPLTEGTMRFPTWC